MSDSNYELDSADAISIDGHIRVKTYDGSKFTHAHLTPMQAIELVGQLDKAIKEAVGKAKFTRANLFSGESKEVG